MIDETLVSQIKDEWKMYVAEKTCYIPPTEGRIDHYWGSIFDIKTLSGEKKYMILPRLIKSILCLQNGNAAVERSLSDNKNTIAPERVRLSPETVVGLRRLKEYGRKAGGAHCVNITDSMMEGMKEASRLNQQRLTEEKQKEKVLIEEREKAESEKQQDREKLKSISDKQKSLEGVDNELDVKETEARNALLVAQGLLFDGSKRLLSSKNDMTSVNIANAMIASAQEKMKQLEEQMLNINAERKNVRKRPQAFLSNCQTELKKKCSDS